MILRKARTIGTLFLLLSIFSFVVPSVLAQDTNVCRDFAPPILEYGDETVGVISAEIPAQIYCFEAERGDIVTLTVESQSSSLIVDVTIATPFLNQQGAFSDEPLAFANATTLGGDVEVTAEIDEDGTYLIFIQSLEQTTGNFDLELEVEEGTTLLGSNPDAPVPMNEVIPGQTDLCNTEETLDLTFGETQSGTFNFSSTILWCFEAVEGQYVNIDVTTANTGDLIFIVASPFWDLQAPEGVFAQGLTQGEEDTDPTDNGFVVRETGEYLIILFPNTQNPINPADTLDYEITIDSATANIYNCDNEPLSTLFNTRWGIMGADGETPSVIFDFTCSNLVSISTLGTPQIARYIVTQDGTVEIINGLYAYEAINLTSDELVLENDEGEQFTLMPLTDPEACAVEELQALVRGSYLFDSVEGPIIFDFTCGGIAIIDLSTEIIGAAYVYDIEEEALTIDGNGLFIPFEDVEVDDDELEVELDGRNLDLPNLNYVEPDETEEE